MKTKLLFTAMVLIGLTSANATDVSFKTQGDDFLNTTRYRSAEPILFMERGVEFLIFPDGSFDFNTNADQFSNTFDASYYYRETGNTRRGSINTTQGAPGTYSRHSNYNSNGGGVLIQHDADGKVRRIGNVFINYDRVGKVKRVGSVYMNYNRSGMLSQVGGLRLTYDRWGEVSNCSGVVNYNNSHNTYAFGQGHTNSTDQYTYSETNEDFYYYKQGNEIKSQKKLKR